MCEPDELHRLEINLYGIHNYLARSYDQIAVAITEIQDARSVVDKLQWGNKTTQEEFDTLSGEHGVYPNEPKKHDDTQIKNESVNK